jgi:hypothetical protein
LGEARDGSWLVFAGGVGRLGRNAPWAKNSSVLEAFRHGRGSVVGHYFDLSCLLLPFASWDKPLLHRRIPSGMSLLPTMGVGCANHRLAGEWRSHHLGRRVRWWQRPLKLSREQPSLDGTRYSVRFFFTHLHSGPCSWPAFYPACFSCLWLLITLWLETSLRSLSIPF